MITIARPPPSYLRFVLPFFSLVLVYCSMLLFLLCPLSFTFFSLIRGSGRSRGVSVDLYTRKGSLSLAVAICTYMKHHRKPPRQTHDDIQPRSTNLTITRHANVEDDFRYRESCRRRHFARCFSPTKVQRARVFLVVSVSIESFSEVRIHGRFFFLPLW